MPEICALDEDNCLSLDAILRAFHCGTKEEQTWALIHQSIAALKEELMQTNDNYSFLKPNTLYIKNNGKVDVKSWRDISTERPQPVSVTTLVSSIGSIIYKALDYGADEDEEIIISQSLEKAFERMTEDTDEEMDDEGICNDSFCEKSLHHLLDELLNRCRERMIDSTDISEHYRQVCRALVAEAIEMSTFLNQITIGTQELKKSHRIDNEEVENIHVEVWAHLWMKVMRQLRVGVSLSHIDRREAENRNQKEYELTPFEMLLDDINSKRYSLKKVVLPKRVEKDARNLILDFIRSRPPLKPVAERQLNPLPPTEPTLHQKLMDGIKSTPPLRPSPRPFERKFDSLHLPRGKRYTAFNDTNHSTEDTPTANVFKRFSFRNLSLRSGAYNRITTLKADPPISDQIMESYAKSRRPSFWDKLYHAIW